MVNNNNNNNDDNDDDDAGAAPGGGAGSSASEPVSSPNAAASTASSSADAGDIINKTSEDLRHRGNYEFSIRNYDVAAQLYSQALGDDVLNYNKNILDDARRRTPLEKNEIILNLCNRSACYFQMNEYEQAKDDAYQAYRMSLSQQSQSQQSAALSAAQQSQAAQTQQTSQIQKQYQHNILKSGFRLAKTYMVLKEYDDAKTIIRDSLKLLDGADEQEKEGGDDDDGKGGEKQQQEGDVEGGKDQQKEQSSDQQQQPPPNLAQHRKSFEDLWKQVLENAYDEKKGGDGGTKLNKTSTAPPETSIKHVQRPVSVKEFNTKLGIEMGYGNFSEIIVVQHNVTGEKFALKIIEKKRAAELAKRQHPNVYNEIHMERRVLLERLPRHYNIVEMYAAFQDYYSLYYLMELHNEWGDLWSEMKYYPSDSIPKPQSNAKYCMIGCHRSQTKIWMAQLLQAIEHMHKHGIVHRDLKPENIILNKRGHVIVIDFGTAKDLIETDLNGPEFVGTPDFMCPEAVSGTSGMNEAAEAVKAGKIGVTHTADLWSYGAILYLLQTGMTPFWSPSTYLAMMRIKRGQLAVTRGRPMGIVDDDAWDLCMQLMQLDPTKRIGSQAFELEVPKDGSKRSIKIKQLGGYTSTIRQHPYFAGVFDNDSSSNLTQQDTDGQDGEDSVMKKKTPIPTLRDLCYPAVAELAYKVSQNVELADKYPPGCRNKQYDFMMLPSQRDRNCVMHILDRMKLLKDPRVYGLFFESLVETRITSKVRPQTHDFVGLTQMNDDMGKPPKATMNDQYATPVQIGDGTIGLVHLTNPLFVKSINESASEDVRKQHVKLLKKCIGLINRNRPKLVVVCGHVDDKCKKLLARINETIPVVVHDNSTNKNAFFTFWLTGVQCIAVRQSADNEDNDQNSEQNLWLREQLEQVRMSKHPLFIFADTDPRKLPLTMLKRLARGRTLSLYGITEDEKPYDDTLSYEPNELIGDDDVSIKSDKSDDEDEKDAFTMKVRATHVNGLRYMTVDEEVPDKWDDTFEEVN